MFAEILLTLFTLVQMPEGASNCISIPFNQDHLNKRLDGHVLTRPMVNGHKDCAYLCVVNTLCESINYDIKSMDCELNTENNDSASGDIVDAPGFVFTDKDVWPRGIARRCAGVECAPGEMCVPPSTCVSRENENDTELQLCVETCVGIQDGDYQSCIGCQVYATCTNGDLYDNRPCPADLVWDDVQKTCDSSSDTCH